MTPIEAGACVTLADESGWWRVTRVQGTVLHVADVKTHHESCVSVDAVVSIASREYGRATRLTRRYRIARRNAWAKTKTLAALREMAPDLVARLMAEAVDEWERAHPTPKEMA